MLLSAPIPAIIGARLARKLGVPSGKPVRTAWPKREPRPPVNCAPPPTLAIGPAATAGGATVGAFAIADAVISAPRCATRLGAFIAFSILAPKEPAGEAAPAVCVPNFSANCCASSGLFRYVATGLAAAPRPMLAPNMPALSLRSPAALCEIEPPSPAIPAIPAPPKAPRPAIKPFFKLPVRAN